MPRGTPNTREAQGSPDMAKNPLLEEADDLYVTQDDTKDKIESGERDIIIRNANDLGIDRPRQLYKGDSTADQHQ